MIIKYRAQIYSRSIKNVEVERETKSSIWINGRRLAKRTKFENYFDTFDAAKNYLVNVASKKLMGARAGLEYAQGFMRDIKSLKKR